MYDTLGVPLQLRNNIKLAIEHHYLFFAHG